MGQRASTSRGAGTGAPSSNAWSAVANHARSAHAAQFAPVGIDLGASSGSHSTSASALAGSPSVMLGGNRVLGPDAARRLQEEAARRHGGAAAVTQPRDIALAETVSIRNIVNIKLDGLKLVEKAGAWRLQVEVDASVPATVEAMFNARPAGDGAALRYEPATGDDSLSTEHPAPSSRDIPGGMRQTVEMDTDVSDAFVRHAVRARASGSSPEASASSPVPIVVAVRASSVGTGEAGVQVVCARILESRVVEVVKRQIEFGGRVLDLHVVFGLGAQQNGDNKTGSVDDEGANCVVCLSEPRTIAILPCRHCCLCEDCSDSFVKSQASCPICRGQIGSLMKFTAT